MIAKQLYYLLLVTLMLSTGSLRAQDLRGYWTGGLRSDTTNVEVINTEYALNVKEQVNNTINGRAYVIENRFRLLGVLDFIGVIDGNKVSITELRILSSRIPTELNRVLCIKKLDLNLNLGNNVDSLSGHWTGVIESGDRCTPGMAYLKRVHAGKIDASDRILSKMLEDNYPSVFLYTSLATPVVVEVQSSTISLKINDYLREDGDTISLYMNRRPLYRKLPVMHKPFVKSLSLDKSSGVQEIIIYAENLGRVPPNTSVLTIDDGFRKQEVRIMSTRQTSAVIYLKYVRPPKRR